MRGRATMLSVAAAAFTLLGTTLAPAQAADAETVADGLITPLSVAVGADGTVYVAQNFAGMLTKVAPAGEPTLVHADESGSEVGAVSVDGEDVTFATTGGTRKKPTAHLWQIAGEGEPTRLANLFRYEKRNNPDAGRTYGIKRPGKSCARKLPDGVKPYPGIVESHPYATALGDGVTYVADAAGNTILGVSGAGKVSTVAVLPSTKIKVTRKIKRAFHLPKCVVGKKMRVEGVPTDVEIGPDGNLYVTSLPGGPEDPVMGANGGIYQVNPTTGDVSKLTGGLTTPVGLAISPTGDAYISMLFASTILKVPFGGTPEPFAQVEAPGDVEFSNGHVYATRTGLMDDPSQPPAGKVLRWNVTPE